ncbi:nitroreductase family protein [Effusibacillus pohliae]|uniref:nitroreductase family protein n=1 Tax=Effusibacillus pohliae TaxID=232270 RepID=UPI00037B8934|nr:nitroreductase family protein [Effusibacillus pohliae]
MNQTNTVISAVRGRRNIKSFKPDPIPRELLEELLEAASYAPNHRLTEPWEILVVGPATRALLNHKTNFGGAPVVLAILSKPANTQVDRDEYYAATACFIQNFMLAAWEKGIGTGWSSLGLSKHAREVLQIEPGYEVVGLIPVGYPAEVPEAKPRTAIGQKIRELS